MSVQEYPRVTEILRAFSSFESVPKDILERAAARGTAVHALCAGLAKGAWLPDIMIDEEFSGYIASFKQWAAMQVSKFVTIEKRFTDEDLKYSGQLDFVILGTDNELYLVDLKTSARPQKTYPVQMAAYDHLLRKHGVNVKGAMLVYLNKDGDFPEINLIEDLSEETYVFMAALDCWHYFNKGKRNVKTRSVCSDRSEKAGAEHLPKDISDHGGTSIHPEGGKDS